MLPNWSWWIIQVDSKWTAEFNPTQHLALSCQQDLTCTSKLVPLLLVLFHVSRRVMCLSATRGRLFSFLTWHLHMATCEYLHRKWPPGDFVKQERQKMHRCVSYTLWKSRISYGLLNHAVAFLHAYIYNVLIWIKAPERLNKVRRKRSWFVFLNAVTWLVNERFWKLQSKVTWPGAASPRGAPRGSLPAGVGRYRWSSWDGPSVSEKRKTASPPPVLRVDPDRSGESQPPTSGCASYSRTGLGWHAGQPVGVKRRTRSLRTLLPSLRLQDLLT